MNRTTPKFAAMGVVLGLIIVAFALPAARSATQQIANGTDLAAACENNPIEGGLRQVTLRSSLKVQNTSITISQPCEVHLSTGVNFAIVNASLVTDNFAIIDDAAAPSTSSIQLTNATLSSSTGGFYVRLQHHGDAISLTNTKLNYPESIGLGVSDTDQNTDSANFRVVNSTFSSTASDSEGITLVSTGSGTFTNSQFRTTANDGLALLYAATCRMTEISGTAPTCQAK